MLRNFAADNPLQASKLALITLTLVFAVGGFLRIIQLPTLLDGPGLGDPQLLALLVTPLVSIALVFIVCVETLYTGIQTLRTDRTVLGALTEKPGYALLRLIEAGVGIIGLALFVIGLRTFVSDPMPAPAGVGLLLAFMAIALTILVISLIRVMVELYRYNAPA